MLIASASDFRKDIKTYLDRVTKNFETLFINHGKDSGSIMIKSRLVNYLQLLHKFRFRYHHQHKIITANGFQVSFLFQRKAVSVKGII